ncbi:hypothetical protein P4B35_19145 [Pontiellaceae bacterium B12227]|nr:hypothetical protein [Pontiellaceae bacterium B12227]
MSTMKRWLVVGFVALFELFSHAESVPMGTFAAIGADVDFTVGGASASGFTMTYANESDGRGDCAARSAAAVLFTQVGDKLTYRCTYDNIANSTNRNNTLRFSFDFGSAACIHFITGYGEAGIEAGGGGIAIDGRVNYNLTGNPFSTGTTVGGADYEFVTNKTSLAFNNGNTIDATIELTVVDIDGTDYDYQVDVTYASATETSMLSRTVIDIPANSIDAVYHLSNDNFLQIAGDTWSVTNAALDFKAYVVPPDFTLNYFEIGGDADSYVTNLSSSGATHKYISDTDGKHDTGIATTIDGSSGVTITNVGDKLVYSFTYQDLVVTPNNNGAQPMRVGFDFGSDACLIHRTAVGSQSDLTFWANDNGNPFSSGTKLSTLATWSDFDHRTIRFDDGNLISATVSLTLQADHGDGTYDYLYEVTYVGASHQNSASQTFTNIAANTVGRLFHVSNESIMNVTGDEWTVANATLIYEPYTLPPTALESWMSDYGITNLYVDTDNDGLDDLGEYAFGGDPTNSGSLGVQPSLQSNGGLKYIYQVIADTNIAHQVVTETDLVVGGGSINVTLDGSGPAADSAFIAYTNSVDTSVETAGFLQVEISEN